MNRFVFLFLLLGGLIVSSCGSKTGFAPTSGELNIKSKWVRNHLVNTDPVLPFSFQYDGRSSSEFLKTWQKKSEIKKLDQNRTQSVYHWADNKTGLEVRCVSVEYLDFPVVEWTVTFRNTGTNNTPILKDIQGLNVQFGKNAGGEFVLNGNKGDWCVAESYEPFRQTLEPNTKTRFAPSGGRPTNGPGGGPYYNLRDPGCWLARAVGQFFRS